MMTCASCGRRVSDLFIALWDYCPGCDAAPFVEIAAQDPERENLPA